jgi:hypothetical protein
MPRWSARSVARTYDLDGDLCVATGCLAEGGRPGQIRGRGHQRSVTACARRENGLVFPTRIVRNQPPSSQAKSRLAQ